MNSLEQLEKRIADKSMKIGIYGLGYVGLPLALRFAEVGVKVVGFDIDAKKIELLNKGLSYIERIIPERIQHALTQGLEATLDFSRSAEMDALIVCVPTPLNRFREPDLSYVINTVESIVPYMRAGQILSLESTTYPGTTDEELATRVQAIGFEIGVDYALVFSPEREDPGNPDYETSSIPKVLGGFTEKCAAIGTALYSVAINKIVPVSTTRAAEMVKLLENIHRSVNIGLVNEMKIVADRMGIDIHEVIRAAATKPFGFVPYYPGPGLGGHCIPIDPYYLTWKAREYGVATRFIELAGEINHYMPKWVLEKISAALNDRRKPVKGSRILVLGIAYKKNIDDTRESPSIEIIDLLTKSGAIVDYSDPHVLDFPAKRNYSYEMKSVALTEDVIAGYDCVIVSTDHDVFDYDRIRNNAQLIIDCRGRYKHNLENVVSA